MPERSIHIENLRIRLHSGQAGQAHAIANAIGGEILHTLAESTEGMNGAMKIGAIEAGTKGMQAGARGTQKRIAGLLSDALLDRIG